MPRAGVGRGDMPPAVFWSGLVSAGLGVVVLLLATEGAAGAAFAVSRRDLILCALMGSVQLGLGSVCYTLGARHLPAAALQLLALLELVFSPLWVWLVVGEVPAPATLGGGGVGAGDAGGGRAGAGGERAAGRRRQALDEAAANRLRGAARLRLPAAAAV